MKIYWNWLETSRKMCITENINFMALYWVKLQAYVMLWWNHMLCHGLTKDYVKQQWWLEVHGFLMWTVGCDVNYLILCNSGQWIFLGWGLVTCNKRTIPLALILRNWMPYYNYGTMQESHHQSKIGYTKKLQMSKPFNVLDAKNYWWLLFELWERINIYFHSACATAHSWSIFEFMNLQCPIDKESDCQLM